eukprot:TRINITY_DN72902_c0_g1_i1.p1 TRINITY_DN72902_c0_g1~~TRINITY_DN72902_c0_g1_i1.p1  ORF type:complete len:649 (+),score=117.79 TRINITY_DN72902_c0_g1_i1:207-1949(+)
MDALASNMRNRAEQSHWLADEIEQDVAGTIETMLRQHAEVSKQVHTDGQRITKTWEETQHSHAQLAAKYARACAAANEFVGDALVSAPQRPAEWKRLAERSITLCKQASLAEREYQQAVRRFNTVASLHERQMSLVMGALQDMEEKRALCFRDTAMKMAVYETSWLRNVQYDLDNSVKTVEASDAVEDLQEFIRRNRSKVPRPETMTMRPYWDILLTSVVAELGSSVAGSSVAKVENGGRAVSSSACAAPGPTSLSSQRSVQAARRIDALRPAVSALLTGMPDTSHAVLDIVRLFTGAAALDRESSGLTPSPLVESLRGCSGAAIRAAFCAALRQELHAKTSGGETRTAEPLGEVYVSAHAFEAFTSLFTAALDECDKESDSWNGRDLMVLAKAIRLDIDEGRTKDVLLKIYSHPLWSRVTFWEDVLLVGIVEAYAQVVSRHPREYFNDAAGKLAEDTNLEDTVEMSAFLRNYASYMVQLGIKPEQAAGAVRRALGKLAQLLGSTDAKAYAHQLTLDLKARDGDRSAAAGRVVPDSAAALGTSTETEDASRDSPAPSEACGIVSADAGVRDSLVDKTLKS